MKSKALIALILCGFLAGSSGVFVKLMSSMDASSIAWIRTMVPTVLLGLWMKYKGIAFFRGRYKKMLLASCLNALRIYLFFLAYILTSIGNAVIVCYTWPLFAALFGAIFINEKLSNKQIFLIFMAFIGLVVAYSDKPISFEDQDFLGMLAAVSTAAIYALTVIIYKSESNYYSRNELIFYQNFLGAFVFLPFFYFGFDSILLNHLGLAFIFSIVIGLIGFNLFFYGLKYLKASIASSIMYLEVLSAIVFSWLIFNDFLSYRMIVGGVIILCASFFITRTE